MLSRQITEGKAALAASTQGSMKRIASSRMPLRRRVFGILKTVQSRPFRLIGFMKRVKNERAGVQD